MIFHQLTGITLPEIESEQGATLKNAIVNVPLFLLVALVYYKSPVHYVEDSKYSLLMD